MLREEGPSSVWAGPRCASWRCYSVWTGFCTGWPRLGNRRHIAPAARPSDRRHIRVIVAMTTAGFVHRALPWSSCSLAAHSWSISSSVSAAQRHHGLCGNLCPAEACAPAVPVVWRTGAWYSALVLPAVRVSLRVSLGERFAQLAGRSSRRRRVSGDDKLCTARRIRSMSPWRP